MRSGCWIKQKHDETGLLTFASVYRGIILNKAACGAKRSCEAKPIYLNPIFINKLIL